MRMAKKKVFIGIGIAVNLLLLLVIFANYQLNNIVDSLNMPLSVNEDTSRLGPEDENQKWNIDAVKKDALDWAGHREGKSADTPGAVKNPQGKQDNEIVRSVQSKLDRPVEKKDLLKAGVIILRKLDTDEIQFLYNVGKSSSPTREELILSREILLGKLTSEEINTLRQLGGKYGKSLRILDNDVPIQ
ncbi:MAG: hypothetical protein PHT79_03910 [Syntrophomonadaceae bacterium]|nr:hypothetical protein [Syntrophomonadaceae bacterium]